jgi:hypothetical protein
MTSPDIALPAPTRASGDTVVPGGALRLVDRWPAMRPFAGIGVACVIAGGLVAAVTRPLAFELGSWLAAFLVLVGGVAQLGLGAGQAWLSDDRPPARLVVREVAAWNAGLAATIAGSLLDLPAVTVAGGVTLVAALALFLVTTRTATQGPTWMRLSYRAVLVVVLSSTPVGLVLAWTRHG